jgi:uncharacterized protein (DUF1501 family)
MDLKRTLTRRHFFGLTSSGIGTAALASLLDPPEAKAALAGFPNFAPKAKSVIFLHQSGGPSQLDLFDPKPGLQKLRGTNIPDSVRMGQRVAQTQGQATLPVAPSTFQFQQHGKSGAWVSELLPHTSKIVDDLAIIRTVNTEAINHDPAITFFQTGFQQPGRPSMGAWISYGIGSENQNLPAFVVLIAQASALNIDQPLFSRLWSAGFLPTTHQGVQLRSAGDPVLFLSDPPGISRTDRRTMLDATAALNELHKQAFADPEIETRIAQFEMAYRMQTSVPELVDISKEPDSVLEMYGPDVKKRGTYASQCLMARRLVERGVRFVQIYKRGWDQHNDLPRDLRLQCESVDQADAALIRDLKQRGLLDQTLVVWGGEFGRTVFCQGRLSETNYGRDHHPRCFTMWMAGGGVKAGTVYGTTDDFSYNVADNPVSVHDVQATILHLLGVDHKKLTYKYQGRHFRLTDVHGEVVNGILS